VIVVPIIASAMLYYMVLGFGGTDNQTPTAQLYKTTTQAGLRFSLSMITKEIPWGDVSILLQSGTIADTWRPTTAGLTGMPGKMLPGYAQPIDSGRYVYCNVTDIAGDGQVDSGDFISLEPGAAFSAYSLYTLTLLHGPTGGMMVSYNFAG